MSDSSNVFLLDSVPSPIDAVKPSPAMSTDTYGFTSSRAILDAFAAHGWVQTDAQTGRPRKNIGFQKHLVRLENPEFQSIEGLSDGNGSKPQLVLLNSHDGTSSLQIFWGLVRMACLNGIIAGTALAHTRLVHSKKVTEKLPDAIAYMLANFPAFVAQVKALQGLKFTPAAQAELVKTVYDSRLEGVGRILSVDYSLPALRRPEDNSDDAFTVFNRIQEVLIRGGIRYTAERRKLDDAGNVISTRIVDAKTRKLSSVPQQVRLNRVVYDSALKLAA